MERKSWLVRPVWTGLERMRIILLKSRKMVLYLKLTLTHQKTIQNILMGCGLKHWTNSKKSVREMGNEALNTLDDPIYPCLWFDGNAKEAAEFYCSVFSDSKIVDENHLVVTFESAGQKFMCLNGGPQFKFNPSISFYTIIKNEDEVQAIWDKLIENGRALMPLDSYPWSKKYGWLHDKFG